VRIHLVFITTASCCSMPMSSAPYAASDRQLKVIIATNGSLLNEEMIVGLNDSGLYSMDISLQFLGENRLGFPAAA